MADLTIYSFDASKLSPQIRGGHLRLGANRNVRREVFMANSLYYSLNGQPWLPVMGEFHYSRYPHRYWEEELLKMKAGGVEIVATYVFWIHHEEQEGVWDWSEDNNLREFIRLCGKHGLRAFVRIGPWCHGECRNGGFPDWVQYRCKPRTNDPAYFVYVRKVYEQISKQCEDFLFRDGGPIIGVQLENEFGHCGGSGGEEHMLMLKNIAREVGFDVPLYTATGWGGSPIPRDEIIPVWGAYPDAPWTPGTEPIAPGNQYLFNVPGDDPTLGSDPAKGRQVAARGFWLPEGCPLTTAEVGTGNQVKYNRRPLFTVGDIDALVYVKLGAGTNLLGYYMYHGGTNPVGKSTTMEEPGYPEISYDFEAALGEFGRPKAWYHSLRNVHMFLRDFGDVLAPMYPVLPQQRPKSATDTDVLRSSVRMKDDGGFLFFSNSHRAVETRDLGPIQFEVKGKKDRIVLPTAPVTIRKDTYAIWPINLPMGRITLRYATAQPFCKVDRPGSVRYMFFATDGVPAEYAIAVEGVKNVEAPGAVVKREGGHMRVSGLRPGTACTVKVTMIDEKEVILNTLTAQQARACWKARIRQKDYVFLSDADILLFRDERIEMYRLGHERVSLSVYPAAEGLRTVYGGVVRGAADGMFSRFEVSEPPCELMVQSREVEPGRAVRSVSGRAGRKFLDPSVKVYGLRVSQTSMEHVNDVFLKIRYAGDTAGLFLDNQLIADDFCHSPAWEVGLKRFAPAVFGKELVLRVSPLKKGAQVLMPAGSVPQFAGDSIAELRDVEAIPEYRFVVTME